MSVLEELHSDTERSVGGERPFGSNERGRFRAGEGAAGPRPARWATGRGAGRRNCDRGGPKVAFFNGAALKEDGETNRKKRATTDARQDVCHLARNKRAPRHTVQFNSRCPRKICENGRNARGKNRVNTEMENKTADLEGGAKDTDAFPTLAHQRIVELRALWHLYGGKESALY